MKPGSRADHGKYCTTEGWQLVRDARGRSVGHHATYELDLPDGRILRTRISRPPNTTTYGPDLWKAILRDQLCVSEDEFWACVTNKTKPDRGGEAGTVPERALPAQLVWQLIREAGVPEADVAGMTLGDAVAKMTEHRSKPRE